MAQVRRFCARFVPVCGRDLRPKLPGVSTMRDALAGGQRWPEALGRHITIRLPIVTEC